MLQPDPVYELKSKTSEPVHSLNFFNQQLQVGKRGSVSVYCLSSLRSNYELKASTSPIIFIASTSDNLFTQDRSGTVKIWDLGKTGYVLRQEIATEHLGFARAKYIAEGNLLVAPSSSSDISVIDLTEGSTIQSLKPPNDDIQMILMSITVIPWMNEGTLILAAYESGHLVLFNMKQPKALHILKFDFGITCCDYDVLSNRGLLSGPSNVTVCVFGLDKEKLQLYRKEAEDIEYVPNDGQKLAGISCIKFRPDKKVIVVGTCDGIIYIHSHKSLRKFATLRNHRGEITDIAFSNGAIDNFKSPIMAVAGSDGNVSLWDIYYK